MCCAGECPSWSRASAGCLAVLATSCGPDGHGANKSLENVSGGPGMQVRKMCFMLSSLAPLSSLNSCFDPMILSRYVCPVFQYDDFCLLWHVFESFMGAVLMKGRIFLCLSYKCSLVCGHGSVCTHTMVRLWQHTKNKKTTCGGFFLQSFYCSLETRVMPNVQRFEKDWFMKGTVLKGAIVRKPSLLGLSVDCSTVGSGACMGQCSKCWSANWVLMNVI
jgi:hypothetical protein